MKFFVSLTIALALIFSIFAFSVDASEVEINYDKVNVMVEFSKFISQVDVKCRDVNIISTIIGIYNHSSCKNYKLEYAGLFTSKTLYWNYKEAEHRVNKFPFLSNNQSIK